MQIRDDTLILYNCFYHKESFFSWKMKLWFLDCYLYCIFSRNFISLKAIYNPIYTYFRGVSGTQSKIYDGTFFRNSEHFHDESLYHVETGPLICLFLYDRGLHYERVKGFSQAAHSEAYWDPVKYGKTFENTCDKTKTYDITFCENR